MRSTDFTKIFTVPTFSTTILFPLLHGIIFEIRVGINQTSNTCKDLRGVSEVTGEFLRKWIEVISHPLIQPSCEKLFELMKNVILSVFEHQIAWNDLDFLKNLLRVNIIQHCPEIQRKSLTGVLCYLFRLSMLDIPILI